MAGTKKHLLCEKPPSKPFLPPGFHINHPALVILHSQVLYLKHSQHQRPVLSGRRVSSDRYSGIHKPVGA